MIFKRFLNKTFGLRDGELHVSFLMQLYIFLIITVLLIVKPTVNALFVSKLGADHLPFGYLLVALTAVITSFFYNKAIKRFSLINVTISSLIFFSIGFLILATMLYFKLLNQSVLYIYYLGVSLFAVIATSQFWILANMVYDSREAKRLFGFIGAGAIAGGIFGGYLTNLIVKISNNAVVIFLAAILILCCIPIIRKVWRLRLRVMNTYVRNQRKLSKTNVSETSIKIISKSKHLTYLALITGISVIVAKLVDFQFSDFANRAIKDSEELTAFFGFWFSSFNVLALLLQLFLTNRVLSKLGVSSTLLILPFGIALFSLLFLSFPELWILILIKGIDGSFKQSLNKAAFELSIMPIPLSIKNQAKSYIDVVVDSIATGFAGLMLILLIRKLNLDTTYITVIIVLFLFIWIFLIYKLREAYYDSFRVNIQSNIFKKDDVLNKNGKAETTLTAAKRILEGDDEMAILNLLDRLGNYKMVTLENSITQLLENPSDHVKAEAIKYLQTYDNAEALDRVKELIHSQNPYLVNTALDYVLYYTASKTHFFKTYLDHEDIFIANAALLGLAKASSSNQNIASEFELNNRVTQKINAINISQINASEKEISGVLITIARAKLKVHYNFIEKHLESINLTIKNNAIKAAGLTNSDYFVDSLLTLVAEKAYRKQAIKALKKYGPKIATTIINQIDNLDTKTKRYIPKIVEAFKTQNAVQILMGLMKSKNFLIRLEASRSLLKLNVNYAKLEFNNRTIKNLILKEAKHYREALIVIMSISKTLNSNSNVIIVNEEEDGLVQARQEIIIILEEQLETSLETIFKLLAIIYNNQDIQITYSGLTSLEKDTKTNALEFLDNLLKGQLKFKLIPLIEYYIAEGDYSKSVLRLKTINEKSYLSLLVRNRGKRIKLAVVHLIKLLDSREFIAIIKPLQKHKNNEVRYAAKYAFKQLNKKQ